MTQFVLGLRPSQNLDGWQVRVNTLGLESASGVIPVGDTLVRVRWTVEQDAVLWVAESDSAVRYVGVAEPVNTIERRLTRVRGDLYA